VDVKHPAKFSNELIPVIAELLAKYKCWRNCLDPFGGTGKLAHIKKYGYAGYVYTADLEQEWVDIANNDPLVDKAFKLDATDLNIFNNGVFESIITSPVYGNRMCFAAGTLITTLSGQKEIENVTTDDFVLTHLGNWEKPLWVGETGKKHIISLVGQGAGVLKLTGDHKILAKSKISSDPKLKLGTAEWVSADSMVGKYWVCWTLAC
jgi:hypothetical protein